MVDIKKRCGGHPVVMPAKEVWLNHSRCQIQRDSHARCRLRATTPGHRYWQVYIAFWQRADRDPIFRREHKRGMSLARSQLQRVLRRRMGDHHDVSRLARRLIALIQGISMQLLFDPQSWAPEEIRNTFAMELASASGS